MFEEIRYQVTMEDVFTLYEAIGFIEANATEESKNMLYSLKNVAYKINYNIMKEEQEAYKNALAERKNEVVSDD